MDINACELCELVELHGKAYSPIGHAYHVIEHDIWEAIYEHHPTSDAVEQEIRWADEAYFDCVECSALADVIHNSIEYRKLVLDLIGRITVG